jgi:DNA-binding GntR family transcriptional regulator
MLVYQHFSEVIGMPDEVTPRLQRVVTVQHATLLWLRERLAAGDLAPGMQLRQEALSTEFGVSVPPVREALKTLEAEGQVVYAPHRGYFVASLSAAELAENYRIRELLETEAAERAVPLMGQAELERMEDAARDMERAHRSEDVRSLTEANHRFHFTVFDAAGLPRMAELIRMLWDTTDRYRSLYFATPVHRRRVNHEHREILAAVAGHDTELAVHLLRAHREHALDALSRVLSREPAESPAPELTSKHPARRSRTPTQAGRGYLPGSAGPVSTGD